MNMPSEDNHGSSAPTETIKGRVLIINASPRRKGLIAQMLEEMQRTLQEAGKEVHLIRTADLQMRHCTGCMYCRSKHACCLPEDDSVRVLEELQACELLIIGAPCYWGNIPGELKILFDRLVYGMMDEDKRGIPIGLMKGKRAAIVSTSTTFWPFNIWFHQTRGVVRALKEILKWSGFRICGTLERGGTKKHPLTPKDLQRAHRLAQKIIR